MQEHPARLIARKRDGGRWTEAQIRDIVSGVVDGSLGDAQLGALLMAVCCRGMEPKEVAALTLAMRDSGEVLQHAHVPGRKVDKHSTGGIGDKVSLILAPWVAAAGVPVPMVSGRGLGHTGGTLDKLESISGYRTDLSPERFGEVLATCGFAMAGAGPSIAPADRRMYAVRDVTATVEHLALITASILSKKLSEGIDGLVMDVKVGRGAFLPERAQAEALARSLVETGAHAELPVVAVLTDMDRPLGLTVGNALEVREAMDCLRGEGPEDVMAVTEALAIEMVLLAGLESDRTAAQSRLGDALRSGAAWQSWERNVLAQGGDPNGWQELPQAPVVQVVESPATGSVLDIAPREVGGAVVDLGGGRRQPTDAVDPAVGVVLSAQVGSQVERGQPLFQVHATDASSANQAARSVLASYTIGAGNADGEGPILGRITPSDPG